MTGLSKEISRNTATHCAALMYGIMSDFIWKGSHNAIEDQGTITFVSYKNKLFGITNQHVVDKAIRAYVSQEDIYVFMAALQCHKHMPLRPIAQFTPDDPDLPFDLAIFPLPPDFLEGSNKTPIDLEMTQLQPMDEGSQGLAVGFPGSQRRMADQNTMSHRLFHVVGRCEGVSDRKLIFKYAFEEEKPAYKFGGMSGGPIFLLNEDGSYEFKGIIFQGKGFGDINEGEPISKEFWIWGFPFSSATLERSCERVGFQI